MISQTSSGSQRGFLSSGLVQSDGAAQRPADRELRAPRTRRPRAPHSFPLSVRLCCFYRVETYAYLHIFVFLKMCYFVNILLCFTVIFVIFRDFLVDDGSALLFLSIFFIVGLIVCFQYR